MTLDEATLVLDEFCDWGPSVATAIGVIMAELRRQRTPSPDGTVRVRAAVAVEFDRRGELAGWHVIGRQDDDHDVVGDVLAKCSSDGTRTVHWIEADVPLQVTKIIEAAVTAPF